MNGEGFAEYKPSCNSDGNKEDRDHYVVPVPHVHQCYTWDCGLACVSMILRMLGEPCDDVYTKDLDAQQCGESVWTIDLAHILHRHNVHLSFYTITLGVHASHKDKSFYKSSIEEDSHRVQRMFDQAPLTGLQVEKRQVTIDDILHHLNKGQPIVVLVNGNIITCLWCRSKLKTCCMFLTCRAHSYQGHFLVLCGFDRQKELLFYKDPDCNAHDMCCTSIEQFEKARTSDGTDEDILFIHSHCKTVGMGDFMVSG